MTSRQTSAAPEPVESIHQILLQLTDYILADEGYDRKIFPKLSLAQAEARIERLLVQAKLEAREDMKKSVSLTILHRVKAKCINKESTEHIQKWAEAKIAALQSQLEAAAGVLASDKQRVRTEAKRNGGEPSA